MRSLILFYKINALFEKNYKTTNKIKLVVYYEPSIQTLNVWKSWLDRFDKSKSGSPRIPHSALLKDPNRVKDPPQYLIGGMK